MQVRIVRTITHIHGASTGIRTSELGAKAVMAIEAAMLPLMPKAKALAA
jgi:hypothetical protein